MKRHKVFLIMLLCLGGIGIRVLAQTAQLVIAPAFSPATSLTSLDAGGSAYPNHDDSADDYRYVDFELKVTHNVQFWTFQATCTAPTATLNGAYTVNASGTDEGDDREPVTIAPVWGSENIDYAKIIGSVTGNGARTVTITRLGSTAPIGKMGVSETNTLAILRYRVNPQADNFTSTASISCTYSFLNRNGNVVATPTVVAAAPLSIRSGFTINGMARYQNRTAHAGIGVYCDKDRDGIEGNPEDPSGMTAANGSYSFGGIRSSGWYECSYFANISAASSPAWTDDNDIYLSSSQLVYVNNSSLTLLPVSLLLGNVDGNMGINSADLASITSFFGLTSPSPFQNGDLNGDRLVNNVDLAILSANFGRGQFARVSGEHFLSSYSTTGLASNRIFLNSEPADGYVTSSQQFVTGTNRDLWPALSPDGSRIAFVRAIGTGASIRYVLHIAPITNGVVGTPSRLTPATNWVYNDFAPSWSPDGTRLAFVCSPGANGSVDHIYDFGSVCSVDVNGRNLQVLAPGSKVYPPAWFDNQVIFFGGSTYGWSEYGLYECPDAICYVNTQTKDVQRLELGFPQGTIQDMPAFSRVGGLTLFYRIGSGGVRQLNYAQIDADYLIDPYDPWDTTAPYHSVVRIGGITSLTESLDYYALETNGQGIVFTEYYDGYYYGGSGCEFHIAHTNSTIPNFPDWNAPIVSYFNGQSCNPWWGNSYSDLHAFRNTIQWLP